MREKGEGLGRVGGGGVGTGKGTGKSMRTRLSKLPFSNLPCLKTCSPLKGTPEAQLDLISTIARLYQNDSTRKVPRSALSRERERAVAGVQLAWRINSGFLHPLSRPDSRGFRHFCGFRDFSKARKPWSANHELRGWQRRGLSRQVSRGAWKKAHKPWIRGNNGAQTVNYGGAKPWSANRELGIFHLQNHVFLNRVQQTVSGNKPSRYPPDTIRWTLFRCSLRGWTVSSGALWGGKPCLDNPVWRPSPANSPDTICWTLFRYTWQNSSISVHDLPFMVLGCTQRGSYSAKGRASAF